MAAGEEEGAQISQPKPMRIEGDITAEIDNDLESEDEGERQSASNHFSLEVSFMDD